MIDRKNKENLFNSEKFKDFYYKEKFQKANPQNFSCIVGQTYSNHFFPKQLIEIRDETLRTSKKQRKSAQENQKNTYK